MGPCESAEGILQPQNNSTIRLHRMELDGLRKGIVLLLEQITSEKTEASSDLTLTAVFRE
jgi:hypothetical protein